MKNVITEFKNELLAMRDRNGELHLKSEVLKAFITVVESIEQLEVINMKQDEIVKKILKDWENEENQLKY